MGWYDAYEQADVAYHAAIERFDHCSWTDQHDAFRAGFVAATGEQKATADRAAAMEAMRGRVLHDQSRSWCADYASIQLGWCMCEAWRDKHGINMDWSSAPPSGVTTPAQAREFALALEVLAEIAEQWEAEAGEAAQT